MSVSLGVPWRPGRRLQGRAARLRRVGDGAGRGSNGRDGDTAQTGGMGDAFLHRMLETSGQMREGVSGNVQ